MGLSCSLPCGSAERLISEKSANTRSMKPAMRCWLAGLALCLANVLPLHAGEPAKRVEHPLAVRIRNRFHGDLARIIHQSLEKGFPGEHLTLTRLRREAPQEVRWVDRWATPRAIITTPEVLYRHPNGVLAVRKYFSDPGTRSQGDVKIFGAFGQLIAIVKVGTYWHQQLMQKIPYISSIEEYGPGETAVKNGRITPREMQRRRTIGIARSRAFKAEGYRPSSQARAPESGAVEKTPANSQAAAITRYRLVSRTIYRAPNGYEPLGKWRPGERLRRWVYNNDGTSCLVQGNPNRAHTETRYDTAGKLIRLARYNAQGSVIESKDFDHAAPAGFPGNSYAPPRVKRDRLRAAQIDREARDVVREHDELARKYGEVWFFGEETDISADPIDFEHPEEREPHPALKLIPRVVLPNPVFGQEILSAP